MIDGTIDLYGTKKEALGWFKKFVKDFEEEEPMKDVIYHFYIGVAVTSKEEIKDAMKSRGTEKMMDKLEEFEEEIEPDLPVEPPKKTLKIREGYA